MKKSVSVIALLAITACAPMVDDFGLPLATPGELPGAESAPVLAAGMQFIEDFNGDVQTTDIVSVRSDGLADYSSDSGWTFSEYAFWLPGVKWNGPNGERGTNNITGGETELFPLRTGKTITMSYAGTFEGGDFSGQRQCTVLGTVEVTAPVGTYDTYRIECIQGGNLEDPFRTRTFYYSPELQVSILRDTRTRDGSDDWQASLIEFKKP